MFAMTRPSPLLQRPSSRRGALQTLLIASAGATGLCTTAGSARAAPDAAASPTVTAAAFPAELPTMLETPKWSGQARLTFFGLGIYDARLWVGPGFAQSNYAASPFLLELRYLRNLYGSAIAKRALQEMERVGPINDNQRKDWLAAMLQAFPDVQEGDRIAGLHQPGTGARFWHNGKLRASIADSEFSRYFFGIWLAASSSEPTLRAQLLQNAAP